jgi:hypothetical protein
MHKRRHGAVRVHRQIGRLTRAAVGPTYVLLLHANAQHLGEPQHLLHIVGRSSSQHLVHRHGRECRTVPRRCVNRDHGRTLVVRRPFTRIAFGRAVKTPRASARLGSGRSDHLLRPSSIGFTVAKQRIVTVALQLPCARSRALQSDVMPTASITPFQCAISLCRNFANSGAATRPRESSATWLFRPCPACS